MYDAEKQWIEEIQEKLDEKLNEWKERTGIKKISFVSVRARN